jgi:hypothetical protein
MMRRFAQAAVVAAAISVPVFTGAMMDHSVVSVLGAPGNNNGAKCSSGCSVGGAAPGSTAQGGHITNPNASFGPQTFSGTLAVTGFGSGTGRFTVGGPFPGTASGNFTDGLPPAKGHCTGQFVGGCVTGPGSP